jgi:hypothetical protein
MILIRGIVDAPGPFVGGDLRMRASWACAVNYVVSCMRRYEPIRRFPLLET